MNCVPPALSDANSLICPCLVNVLRMSPELKGTRLKLAHRIDPAAYLTCRRSLKNTGMSPYQNRNR